MKLDKIAFAKGLVENLTKESAIPWGSISKATAGLGSAAGSLYGVDKLHNAVDNPDYQKYLQARDTGLLDANNQIHPFSPEPLPQGQQLNKWNLFNIPKAEAAKASLTGRGVLDPSGDINLGGAAKDWFKNINWPTAGNKAVNWMQDNWKTALPIGLGAVGLPFLLHSMFSSSQPKREPINININGRPQNQHSDVEDFASKYSSEKKADLIRPIMQQSMNSALNYAITSKAVNDFKKKTEEREKEELPSTFEVGTNSDQVNALLKHDPRIKKYIQNVAAQSEQKVDKDPTLN